MRSPSCPSPCPRRSGARRPPAAVAAPPFAGAASPLGGREGLSVHVHRRRARRQSGYAPPPSPRRRCSTTGRVPPVCPHSSSRHCGQKSCPLPIGTEQPTAWRGPGRGGARGAALAASTSCTPSRARRLSAARAPRARRRAAAPSPFRRTTAESLARLSLRRAAAVALLLVWSTPSRGRRSVELVDAHDARAASR